MVVEKKQFIGKAVIISSFIMPFFASLLWGIILLMSSGSIPFIGLLLLSFIVASLAVCFYFGPMMYIAITILMRRIQKKSLMYLSIAIIGAFISFLSFYLLPSILYGRHNISSMDIVIALYFIFLGALHPLLALYINKNHLK